MATFHPLPRRPSWRAAAADRGSSTLSSYNHPGPPPLDVLGSLLSSQTSLGGVRSGGRAASAGRSSAGRRSRYVVRINMLSTGSCTRRQGGLLVLWGGRGAVSRRVGTRRCGQDEWGREDVNELGGSEGAGLTWLLGGWGYVKQGNRRVDVAELVYEFRVPRTTLQETIILVVEPVPPVAQSHVVLVAECQVIVNMGGLLLRRANTTTAVGKITSILAAGGAPLPVRFGWSCASAHRCSGKRRTAATETSVMWHPRPLQKRRALHSRRGSPLLMKAFSPRNSPRNRSL